MQPLSRSIGQSVSQSVRDLAALGGAEADDGSFRNFQRLPQPSASTLVTTVKPTS